MLFLFFLFFFHSGSRAILFFTRSLFPLSSLNKALIHQGNQICPELSVLLFIPCFGHFQNVKDLWFWN